MSFEAMLARYAQREQADAEAAGMTLEAYRAKLAAEEAERCAQEERERVINDARKRRSYQLGVMARHMPDAAYRAVVEDTLQETATLTFVKAWLRAEPRPPIALLTGHTGCGKTIAAAWGLCRTSGGEYVHARDLGARYMPYSYDEARGITPLRMNASMLVLDDVGTERRSRDGDAVADDRFTEALAMILETRQSGEAPTIIITNHTPKTFIATYCKDPRDKSRFTAMAAVCEGGRRDLRQ